MFTLEIPGSTQAMGFTSAGILENGLLAMRAEYVAEMGPLEGVRFCYEFQKAKAPDPETAVGYDVEVYVSNGLEFLRLLLPYLANPVGKCLPRGIGCHPGDLGLLLLKLEVAEARES
jgi:hypothetical protein